MSGGEGERKKVARAPGSRAQGRVQDRAQGRAGLRAVQFRASCNEPVVPRVTVVAEPVIGC